MKSIRRREIKTWGRRLLSFVLVTALMLGLIPESAYGAGTQSRAAGEAVYTSGDCDITYKETNTWGNYVNVDVTITNNGDGTIDPWKLLLLYDGTISNIWNADIEASGEGKYRIAAKSYNAKLEAGKSVSFGFTACGETEKPEAPLGISMEGAASGTTEEKTTQEEQNTTEQEGGSTGQVEAGGTEDTGKPSGGGTHTGSSYTIPEKWKGLNYALFTSGTETLSLYTNETRIYGDVHSNRDFYYQGTSIKVDGTLEAVGSIDLKTASGADCQQTGRQQEKAGSLEMPDITKEVSAYCRENGTVYDGTTDFNSDSIVVDKPVLIEGSANFNATSFLGKGIIYAEDSVTCNVGSLATPEDSRVFIAAGNGNITLNGSDITLNAVLYAPDGCVTINADRVNLNGRIIAKQVRINGTLINIHAGPYDLDMLDFLFKPEIALHFDGNKKENRKVTIDVEEILNTGYIVKENTVWSITKDGRKAEDTAAVDEEASDAFHKEMIFREAGTYEVSVTVTTGRVDYTITKELVIEKDLVPVAAFSLEQGYYSRDEKGHAGIIIKDASGSPDGDAIGQRIWTVYYDADNNGEFTEQEASVYSDGNETELSIDTDKVGKYKVVLTAVETFADTIPKLLGEDAYRKDDTSEYAAEACVFEVGNEAPEARLTVEKSKSADIVFTLGDADKETMDTYNAKAEELKKILKEKGVDARIDAVTTSTLTAQDTFAWKEYDHYNYRDRYLPAMEKHILYEGDDIRMMGYSQMPIKDFLYVADDNPGQKTFEFDLQRDQTDWHSMEGGGFLFNTTVSDEDNTIRGFCILVTQSGLRLVQIDCKNLRGGFQNGSYSWVQDAGKLLGTYKIDDLYANHHFRIAVDARTISVWDGEKLVIDNFILPENDYGYGYGPIISHTNHGCAQQSYFTFKNITMQTMTGSSLSDIVAGYEWRPGASHYVISLSETEVPELSTDEETADLAAALIQNEAAFVGIGNESNENQYQSLLNATETGGMYTEIGETGTTMDRVNAFLASDILSKDYSVGEYLTTDDIISYGGYYRDAENDEIYEQQWEYEYDSSVFGSSTGETEHIVRKENEPLTTFTETGAYAIRLKLRDNPAGDNDALDSYRLWSGTDEYEKLVVVQSRPVASVKAEVSGNPSDKTTCIVNTTYEAADADHPGDAAKGIREEYCAYKNVKDAEWTEGRLPNRVAVGETYLVKYRVKDVEGTWSFPAVAVVKTKDLLSYEEPENTTPPEIFIETSKMEAKAGEELRIEGWASDDYGVDTFTMSINGEKVLNSFGRVLYTPDKAGTITVKAEAADIGGNRSEKELTITVVDDRDKTAPVAEITSPSAGSELDFNVQIKGTAKDETKFSRYTLSYKEEQDKEYTVFKESDTPVSNDILGTLDISDFTDGTYEILLTAEDAAGNVSYYGILLYIETGVTRGYRLKAEITDVKYNEETDAVDIYGTVSGEGHLKGYSLAYQYQAEEPQDKVTVSEGTEEVTEGLLGSIPAEDLKPGTYNLTLDITDTEGNGGTACGAFTYTEETEEGERPQLSLDLNAPEAAITGLKLSDDHGYVEIRGTVKDDKELKGWLLDFAKEGSGEYTELASGTEAAEDAPLAGIPAETLEDGAYSLRLTAWDAYGNRVIYTTGFTYQKGSGKLETEGGSSEESPGEPVKKNFAVNLSHSAADTGTEVQVQVTLPDNVKEETLQIRQGDRVLAGGSRKAVFTSDRTGTVTITAEGMTEEGETLTAEAKCTFYNLTDKNPPTAAITSPTIDTVLSEPVDFVGSAYDAEGLDFWKLEYRMAGEEEYMLLNEGTEPVKDGVLGHLDTTMLMNGQYNVRLTVQDEGGNVRRLENDYVVEGELKVGAMHIGFTDITAQMGGTTVSMNRMYDSRNKTKGDFGYGWTLGMQGMEIMESHSIADGYEMVRSGSLFSIGYQMTETVSHDVVVTYGDGTSDRFELTFSPERKALVPISEVTLGYKCVTDQKVKLEIIGDTTAYVAGPELMFYNEGMYDDLDYKLTTEDGVEIYLNQKSGVYKMADSNGNIITVDEDGYHAEDGRSITFTRDEEDRIVKAEDPSGRTTTYEYDKAGDLVSVTDAADRTVTFTYDKKHNLASITDPMGIAVARNEYDDDGRLVATIDADGNRTEYEHDVESRTELVTDRLGNKTLYVYDDAGNVLSTTDANGNTTKSTYDSFGNVLTKTDAKGNVTGYAYDENGNLTTVTDASGNSVKNTYNGSNLITSMKGVNDTEILIDYDANGHLSATTDAEENVTSYTNDKNGNVTGMADEIGTVMSAKYDKDGNVTETEDSAGNKTVNTYDASGNRLTQTTYAVTEKGTVERTTRYIYNDAGELVQTVDANGNTTSVERNANGKMSAAVDSKGRRTEYCYDKYGNVSEILYSDGTTETFEYDAEGRNTKTTNRLGLTVTYTYDKVGNLLKQTDARGNSTVYTYDKNYNLLTVTTPAGAVTTYTYDEGNRNTAIEDAEGNVTRFTYDEMSLQTSMTDAKGNVTRYAYDKNGNRTKVIYADGTCAETEYDERGRTIWQKDAAGRKTEYTYDDSDRLTQVKQNNGSVIGYTYDQTGNLTGITDANGNTTTYVYDEDGRRVKTILADGAESTSEYDSYGMLRSTTDYNGVTTTYTYDGEDRIIKETTGTEITEYTYDNLGRLTDMEAGDSHITYTYNRYGELSGKTYENGQNISYAYDRYGRSSEIKVTQGDKVLSSTKYGYDTMDRLTRVIAHDGTATVYTYDENGNRKTATFANGEVLTYSYDECNRLVLQKTVDKNGTVIAQYEYTLGKGGEQEKVTESGACGSVETSYDYDKAGRLTKEVIEKNNEKTTYIYTYDAVGNRISKNENGEKTEYTYNSRNQLVTETFATGTVTYSYDANGSLLNQSGAGKAVTYTYDVYNRLIQYTDGSHTETYTYDAEGVRRSKKNETENLLFISDTTGSLSQTLAETDGKENLIAAYTMADVLISQTRNGETSYYLYDGHGDVRALLNEAGRITDRYRYNAYGELVEQTGDTENHYLYTGEYYDGTSNLYYLRARYMNPSTGTFISMDTYEGSIYDPDTLHKYLYANGNPVTYSDPSGNFFSAVGTLVATTISTVYNNFDTLNAMGIISGLTNSAITAFLGGSDMEITKAFVTGYLTGFGLGAVMYVAAAYEIMTIAQMCMIMAAANTTMSMVMTIGAIVSGNKKEAIVYGTLSILSLFTFCKLYNYNCTVDVIGDKGSARIGWEYNNPEEVQIEKDSNTKDIYRAVGAEEYEDIMTTHEFRGSEGTFAAKEFGNSFEETLNSHLRYFKGFNNCYILL